MPDGLIGQAQGLSQMRTITRLQETKQGRISVFFDGEFDFSVDEETFVLHHLKVGQRYTEEQYQELRQDTQYRKAKEKAFLLLSHHSWTRTDVIGTAGMGFCTGLCAGGSGPGRGAGLGK